jgi:hypothetical protein
MAWIPAFVEKAFSVVGEKEAAVMQAKKPVAAMTTWMLKPVLVEVPVMLMAAMAAMMGQAVTCHCRQY